MHRVLFLTAFATACVPKGKHLRELDAVKQTQAAVQTELDLAEHRLKAATASLAHETDVSTSLRDRIAKLDTRNAELATQLEKVGEELAALGTRNAAQAEQKKSLEALVGQLRSDADTARLDAQTAQEEAEQAARRAEELDAERTRLAAEAERLAAEKAALEQTTAEYDALVGELQGEIDAGQVTITELSGKLTVNMSNAILFSSGSTRVKPEGKAALAKVAGVLTDLADREIRVEGHTDDVPVGGGAPYADNWELSALRASGVVRLLIEGGVDPLNIAAVGYGEHRPAVANDSRANRAQNRRTEIVLVPRLR